jgi:hypothetical protein
MGESNSEAWSWEIGTDPGEIHALLCSSDAFQAERYRSPVPARNPGTTEQRVREGAVHVLRTGGRLAAMFTLTWAAPGGAEAAEAAQDPGAGRAAYLGRLAVDPNDLVGNPMVGVQCVRRAIETARAAGAEVLRSEANPDLAGTWEMLRQLGFEQLGPVEEEAGVRRARLQKQLRTPAG